MPKKNMTRNRIREGILFTLGLLILWQLVYQLGCHTFQWWKPYAMPNPMGVWEAFLHLCKDGTLVLAVVYSLVRGAVGFGIAVVLGTLFGMCLVKFSFLNRNLKPLFMGMQALPSICWVPFAILWFGLKESAIIFVVIMGASFGIALAVEQGVRSVNPLYIKAAKTMGTRGKDLYIRVIFPACIPSFLGGLRQGWSFAWRALMSGEVMSSSIGLGYSLMMGRDLADINQVMLIMLVIIFVGVVIDRAIFSRLEEKVLRKRGIMPLK